MITVVVVMTTTTTMMMTMMTPLNDQTDTNIPGGFNTYNPLKHPYLSSIEQRLGAFKSFSSECKGGMKARRDLSFADHVSLVPYRMKFASQDLNYQTRKNPHVRLLAFPTDDA